MTEREEITQKAETELKNVRRVLWHWGRADRRIGELIEQIKLAHDRVNQLYESIGGGRAMDGQPHGTTPGDPVMRAYERIEHVRELFAQEIAVCEDEMRQEQELKAAMHEAMQALKPVEREILTLRYKGGHTWEYIGIMTHMDERTARRYDESACMALGNRIVFGEIRRV